MRRKMNAESRCNKKRVKLKKKRKTKEKRRRGRYQGLEARIRGSGRRKRDV